MATWELAADRSELSESPKASFGLSWNSLIWSLELRAWSLEVRESLREWHKYQSSERTQCLCPTPRHPSLKQQAGSLKPDSAKFLTRVLTSSGLRVFTLCHAIPHLLTWGLLHHKSPDTFLMEFPQGLEEWTASNAIQVTCLSLAAQYSSKAV